MRRRQFIALVASTTVWPLAARAQQVVPVIGWLSGRSSAREADWLAPFREGLRESGFVEGQNVSAEYRFAEDDNERLRGLADDLVSRRVNVIVAAGGTPTALAAREATRAIPVVFLVTADPVRAGLVASLNRPGHNVTGIAGFTDVIIAKRLELLIELVPGAAVFGLLLNKNNPNSGDRISDFASAARHLKCEVRTFGVSDVDDLEKVLATVAAEKVGGLVVQNDTLFLHHSERLAALASRSRLPTIFEERESVLSGGLMSYGANRKELLRRLGNYTGRILRGENPSTLPVDLPTTFELVINLKTANGLRLDVPPALLARADQVIE